MFSSWFFCQFPHRNLIGTNYILYVFVSQTIFWENHYEVAISRPFGPIHVSYKTLWLLNRTRDRHHLDVIIHLITCSKIWSMTRFWNTIFHIHVFNMLILRHCLEQYTWLVHPIYKVGATILLKLWSILWAAPIQWMGRWIQTGSPSAGDLQNVIV